MSVLGVLLGLMASMAYTAIPVIDSDFSDIIGVDPEGGSICELNDEDANADAEFSSISVGYHHSCALTGEGTVKCWGFGLYGQLGDGKKQSSSTPVEVKINGIKTISTGGHHTCALTDGGTVKCWGGGSSGQLGNGGATSRPTPVDVQTSGLDNMALSGITTISSGQYHTCALTEEETVKCWGQGSFGALGNGKSYRSLTPVAVQGLSDITAISSGGYHTCALTERETVKCWGRGTFGALGNGSILTKKTPVDVQTSKFTSSVLSNIMAISSGRNHTCALGNDGIVKCWGDGYYGQLGNGQKVSGLEPVNVHGSNSGSTPLNDIAAIESGGDHTCALTNGGTVKCWGYGIYGQLGNGRTTSRGRPVDVRSGGLNSLALRGVLAISSGEKHTCALVDEGVVKCWGYGGSGQLGHGRNASSTAPVETTSANKLSAAAQCQWKSRQVPIPLADD